jgi:hypothetical protein
MSESAYIDIYNEWKNKAIKAGFTLNQFRSAYGNLVSSKEDCEMTKAIGAKMAFRSLQTIRKAELDQVQKEMENVQWL